MLTNKKRMVVALAFILVIATAISVSGCGLGGDPKSVVSAFFDSIDKSDSKKFLNCFQKDSQDLILETLDEDLLKETLTTMDETLSDTYGKTWRKQVKIGKAEKTDTSDGITYYDVVCTMDGEESTITVIKVKGKYYIDESSMGGFMY